MKPATSLRAIAPALLCLVVLTSSGFAATTPLNHPWGIAVDAKGNLYVANSGANNILVYNANYTQVKKSTITANISFPTAVAIDSHGNLWVANSDPYYPNISEYTNGQQNASATIYDHILSPEALAIDGADNIWVANNFADITVYAPPALYVSGTTLARIFTPQSEISGLTVQNGTVAWGGLSSVNFASSTLGLVDNYFISAGYGNDDGFCLATDAKGNVYMGNSDGTLNVATAAYEYQFAQLNYTPFGIAIDNARGRVYVSRMDVNEIYVYNMSGSLLKIIQ
jgi:DNA-binding beta-propeller fold protein YncE